MARQADKRDYFTDQGIVIDPYSYLASIREQGPVYHLQERDLILITGYEEAIEVLRNSQDFSSVIAPAGPLVALPFEPSGDDITEQIEQSRAQMLASDMLPANDGERHTALRSLINKLFTPKRLKEMEVYMASLADDLVTQIAGKEQSEVISELATPFVTLVIANLLGVPAEDRELFSEVIDAGPPPFDINSDPVAPTTEPNNFMVRMGTYFYNYITERRSSPRNDVLSELANATFPDGSIPDEIDVVKTVMFLFGAGQDTTGKLIGNSLRYLAEHQEMQSLLRDDRSKISDFIEEMLRIEGSVKATFRLTRKTSSIGGVTIPAGKRVVVFLAGANHDPDRWSLPDEFQLMREGANRHVAFGQGLHTCIGAPLARAETRIVLDNMLAKTSGFRLSEQHYGNTDQAQFDYEASYVIRGLNKLHLAMQP